MVRLFAIFCLILQPFVTTAWDLAVAVDKRVELITDDGSFSIENVLEEPFAMSALALDPNRNALYVSNTLQPSEIYRISLGPDYQSEFLIKEPSSPEKRSMILGIVHDHKNNILYWSNGIGGDILSVELNKKGANRTVIHHFENRTTTGLALDECNGILYWTSYNLKESVGYIESSNLDGSNHVIVMKEEKARPNDITIDHQAQKLYWCDDREDISFRIERSNMDGSSREVVVGDINQKPYSIALTSKYVYWTDNGFHMLWKAEKERKQSKVHIYEFTSNKARGIVSRENSLPADCTIVINKSKTKPVAHQNLAPIPSVVETDKQKSEQQSMVETGHKVATNKCLNGGTLDLDSPNPEAKCKCMRDFHGPQCEIPICYNYCVNGKCYVDSQGYAQCHCYQGYHGARCENDVCDNFCLNGGRCSIGSQGGPICTCSGDFQGRHCEIRCSQYCQQNHAFVPIDSGIPLCSCNEIYQVSTLENGTYSPQIAEKNNMDLQMPLTVGLIVIGILCIIFILCSIVLLRAVLKLRRRPRIKKRIIVNKNVTPTPLTSRPPPPGDQCEITIENCCNMNICETVSSPNPRNHLKSFTNTSHSICT